MRLRDERALRDALRNDGWTDENIDSFIEDEEEEGEVLIEDEWLFARFLETEGENA